MITVTYSGFDETIELLDKVQHIDSPIMQGIRELMEEAENIVNSWYSLQGNGNDDFVTSIDELPNGYVLTASGEDVGFLEFGAGVLVGESGVDEFVSEVDYPVEKGSWSDSHEHSNNPNARYYSKNQFWWYNKIRYTGLFATRGMQRALEMLRSEIDEYINEKIRAWIGN